MEARIRKIGNSKGILIPDAVLKQCDIKENVLLEVKDSSIIIRSKPVNPRFDWEEKFDKLFSEEDIDVLKNVKNKFDNEEWTW